MAKKQRTEGAAKRDLTKICAFWALFIASVLFVVQLILNAVGADMGSLKNIFTIIAALMLGIAIAFPAWSYACAKGKGWKIVCIILLVLYFVLAICGNIIF